jgi:hypothetical protein
MPATDAAHGLDLAEVVLGLLLELIGQRLEVIRAGKRIDRLGDADLVRDDLLRAQRDLHRLVAR